MPANLEEQLFRLDQLVQASGMQPLSAEELQAAAQQLMGQPQPQPTQPMGQMMPPTGM